MAYLDGDGIMRYEAVTARGVYIDPGCEATVTLERELLHPRAVFRGICHVDHRGDYLVLGPIGTRFDFLTVTWRPSTQLSTGCFTGSVEQFEQQLNAKRGGETHKEYSAVILMIKALRETREPHDSGSPGWENPGEGERDA